MNSHSNVDVTFECIPLRSIARWDTSSEESWDDDPESQALRRRMRRAATRHGLYNSYYLCHGLAVFRLTNDDKVGHLGFHFEGTVLTDSHDRHAVGADFAVELSEESCDWLTAEAAAWFRETVRRAVLVEFNRYVDACDPSRTTDRNARLEADTVACEGFVAAGL